MENKLQQIEIAVKDLIKYYCPDVSFVWDRSIRRKGQYRHDVRQIGISKPLATLNTFESMLLTVIHEIAHALTPCTGHKKEWRKVCLMLGGDGKTHYDPNETKTPAVKWVLLHDGSPTTITTYRRRKIYTLRHIYTWGLIK